MKFILQVVLFISFLFLTKSSNLGEFDRQESEHKSSSDTLKKSTPNVAFVAAVIYNSKNDEPKEDKEDQKLSNSSCSSWQYVYFWSGIAALVLIFIIEAFWPSPKEETLRHGNDIFSSSTC